METYMNKTSFVLMLTSDILYIYFSFIIKSSIYAVFRFFFVAWRDIYFIFAHDLARICISKKYCRSLSEANGHPHKRYRDGSRGGRSPFLVHLNQRSMWTIAITWRPSSVVCCLSSVNFSHFKLLLRNHWADWNQT